MPVALSMPRMKNTEFKRKSWHVVPEEGVSFADMQAPEFWSHVARNLAPGDLIEVHAEDGSWFGELLVRDASNNAAVVAPIRFVEFEAKPEAPSFTDGFTVEFKGPQRKWSVIRKADGEYIKQGLATKEQAMAELADYKRALGQ